MTDLNAEVGARVRRLRRDTGMTQGQLGERLAEWLPGRWQRQIVHNGEAGRRPWSVVELDALASILNVSIGDLLPGAGERVTRQSRLALDDVEHALRELTARVEELRGLVTIEEAHAAGEASPAVETISARRELL